MTILKEDDIRTLQGESQYIDQESQFKSNLIKKPKARITVENYATATNLNFKKMADKKHSAITVK